jgi:hypothetical protein
MAMLLSALAGAGRAVEKNNITYKQLRTFLKILENKNAY